MKKRSSLVALTAVALLVAALGIVVQILSGTDYPAVPPGVLILAIPAILVWFVPWPVATQCRKGIRRC